MVGVSFGFLAGVAFAHIRPLERIFQPYLVALQAIPIVAIAPLLVIWFGSGLVGKVVLAAFISIFPVVVATTYGLGRVRTETLDLMHILSARPHHVFFKLRLPTSLPFIFSALRVSATLSVIGAIVAEIAGANAGIGHRIMIASYRTETAAMFAAIACASFLGLVFYGTVRAIGAYVLTNHDHEYTGM
jgi:NitT/TauT family transport system permease protein